MKTVQGLIEAGEPLIQQAIDAHRIYHAAEVQKRPAAEVERLRLKAESLFEAVTDYQLRALGGTCATRH
ncbi:hypothetical protein EI534_41105, partial [Pseudomonas frederiksbergensis]|nr:hypothetical protein [Pseudomonas donghuensis]MCE6983643.1 hypothetical protein [Pseudomonas frederiksbergensis]